MCVCECAVAVSVRKFRKGRRRKIKRGKRMVKRVRKKDLEIK